jgi:hypothetical protein
MGRGCGDASRALLFFQSFKLLARLRRISARLIDEP